ncbi:MAG: hypothetical protein WCK10_00495 [Candidatus Staskawiczbacteria bacterium]
MTKFFVYDKVLVVHLQLKAERKEKMSKITVSILLLVMSIFFGGCSGKEDPAKALSKYIDVSKLYIDSVPPGAEVYNILDKKFDEDDMKLLGKTPLIVNASECSSRKFFVCMKIDFYLSKVEKIPEIKDWVTKFKLEQEQGGKSGSVLKYFNFDTFDLRSMKALNSEKLFATGPIYEIKGPMNNRECAIFLPKGLPMSVMYPLMPPRGTFNGVDETWHSRLAQCQFSEIQIKEAMESMSRCGKYFVRIKIPSKPKSAHEYNLVSQRGGDKLVTLSEAEIPKFFD